LKFQELNCFTYDTHNGKTKSLTELELSNMQCTVPANTRVFSTEVYANQITLTLCPITENNYLINFTA